MGVCGEEPLDGAPRFEGSTLPGWVASCWHSLVKSAVIWAIIGMSVRARPVHVVANSWL